MRVFLGSRRGPATAVALCAGFLLASAGAAEGNGERFALRPSLRMAVIADDNSGLEFDSGAEDQIALWVEPRLEIEYLRPSLRLGSHLAADLRASDEGEYTEIFYDLHAFAEWKPLRGLTLSLRDSYVPQAVRLRSPADDTENMIQSNLLEAEIRWRREGSRGRALELGVNASNFDTRGFSAALDLDGSGTPNETENLRADYWGTGAFVELQYGLGRRGLAYLRGEATQRAFAEIPRADFMEYSGLIGMRRKAGARLELDTAVGWGAVYFEDLGKDSRLLGRAKLDWRLPHGWRLNGLFTQRFTAGAASSDFDETSLRLGVDKELGARTELSAGVLFSRFRDDDPEAETTHVTAMELGLRRQLGRRVTGRLAFRNWRNGKRPFEDNIEQNRVTFELIYRR